jgi:hypothetical protein
MSTMQKNNQKITTIRLLCALPDDQAKLLNMGCEVLGFRVLVAQSTYNILFMFFWAKNKATTVGHPLAYN